MSDYRSRNTQTICCLARCCSRLIFSMWFSSSRSLSPFSLCWEVLLQEKQHVYSHIHHCFSFCCCRKNAKEKGILSFSYCRNGVRRRREKTTAHFDIGLCSLSSVTSIPESKQTEKSKTPFVFSPEDELNGLKETQQARFSRRLLQRYVLPSIDFVTWRTKVSPSQNFFSLQIHPISLWRIN